jgi:hypothetical protein
MLNFTISNVIHDMVSPTTLYQVWFIWWKHHIIERSISKCVKICSMMKAFIKGGSRQWWQSHRNLKLWSMGFGVEGLSKFGFLRSWPLIVYKDCASHVRIRVWRISQNLQQNIAHDQNMRRKPCQRVMHWLRQS